MIVSVPEGWSSASRQRGGGLSTADTSLDMASVANVFADPCQQDPNPDSFDPPTTMIDPSIGSTVDELASALASIPGVATTAPVEVTRAGFWGVQMNLAAPTDLSDCEGETLYFWATTPTGGETWYGTSLPGWIHRVWILDVIGQRFVIDAASAPVQASKIDLNYCGWSPESKFNLELGESVDGNQPFSYPSRPKVPQGVLVDSRAREPADRKAGGSSFALRRLALSGSRGVRLPGKWDEGIDAAEVRRFGNNQGDLPFPFLA